MDTIEAGDERNAQREIIRRSFTDTVEEVGIAICDTSYSDFLSIPTTGRSRVTPTASFLAPHEYIQRLASSHPNR